MKGGGSLVRLISSCRIYSTIRIVSSACARASNSTARLPFVLPPFKKLTRKILLRRWKTGMFLSISFFIPPLRRSTPCIPSVFSFWTFPPFALPRNYRQSSRLRAFSCDTTDEERTRRHCDELRSRGGEGRGKKNTEETLWSIPRTPLFFFSFFFFRYIFIFIFMWNKLLDIFSDT